MFSDEMISIVTFLKAQNNVQVYYDKTEEDFVVPCMHIPLPENIPVPDTVKTFKNQYSLFVTLFEATTFESERKAGDIVSQIWRMGVKIPLLDSAGDPTNRGLKISNAVHTNTEIGVSQVTIEWSTNQLFDAQSFVKIQRFFLDYMLKT